MLKNNKENKNKEFFFDLPDRFFTNNEIDRTSPS